MTAELNKRASDQGLLSATGNVARSTSRTLWNWFEQHHVDSLAVIGVSLWLTIRVVEWSMEFSYDVETKLSGTDKAAIIAAVMTPFGIMQALLFKFYTDLKAKKNGTTT